MAMVARTIGVLKHTQRDTRRKARARLSSKSVSLRLLPPYGLIGKGGHHLFLQQGTCR